MVVNSDPSSQQHAIVVIAIVSPIVSSLFMSLRVWTRAFITHSVGWDDCKPPYLSISSGVFYMVKPISHVIDFAIVT